MLTRMFSTTFHIQFDCSRHLTDLDTTFDRNAIYAACFQKCTQRVQQKILSSILCKKVYYIYRRTLYSKRKEPYHVLRSYQRVLRDLRNNVKKPAAVLKKTVRKVTNVLVVNNQQDYLLKYKVLLCSRLSREVSLESLKYTALHSIWLIHFARLLYTRVCNNYNYYATSALSYGVWSRAELFIQPM